LPRYTEAVERLIEQFGKLPGIGSKTAERLAHYILSASPEEALGLADAIQAVKKNIRPCQTCYNLTEQDECGICRSADRDHSVQYIVAIGLILTPYTTRVVRTAVLGVRNLQYIEAATALGSGHLRIMARHVLPNVAAPIIVVASVNIGLAILIEASVSFLGLGVSSDTNPSWGRMLQETRNVWQQAWWTAIIPGAAISVAVLAFNVFGDALRDALDPRLRGTR